MRDATSNDDANITSKQLAELSRCAAHPQKYPTLFAMLWKRITHYKHHRHIDKALCVLIYLVRTKPPTAEVQRRLIDDILQPSQFTDLRLLANLRERANFPVLAQIKRAAQDLLDWLMQMRHLDPTKLTPIAPDGFDLPDPTPDDDHHNNKQFENGGFMSQQGVQQQMQNQKMDMFYT